VDFLNDKRDMFGPQGACHRQPDTQGRKLSADRLQSFQRHMVEKGVAIFGKSVDEDNWRFNGQSDF
jgi:hypothetical protein